MVGTDAALLGPVGSGPDVTRWVRGQGHEVDIRDFWLVVWLTGPVPQPFAPFVEGNKAFCILPYPPSSSLVLWIWVAQLLGLGKLSSIQ